MHKSGELLSGPKAHGPKVAPLAPIPLAQLASPMIALDGHKIESSNNQFVQLEPDWTCPASVGREAKAEPTSWGQLAGWS